MSLTNYPHGVSSYGIPVIGMGSAPMPIPGNVYFVHPAQDSSLGSIGAKTASDGNPGTLEKPLSTISRAQTVMTANQNDTAIIIGNSSASSGNVVSESSAVTWSKDLTHIVGTAYNRVSHRVSIRQANSDIANFITVSADGCVFANFHVFSDDDTDESEIAWTETGQRNAHYNLHIGAMGNTGASNPRDDAGSRDVKMTGDGERYWKDCVIGLDTADRGAANACLELSSAAVRDWFEDVMFQIRTDAASPLFLHADSSGGIDRWIYFKHCMFHNHGTSMTEALNVHASVGGSIILHDCQLIGAGDWENVASTNVYVEAALAAATSGRMVAATT